MPDSAAAILHLTAAAGGGADRYVRDAAAASARRHLIWHAADPIDVIEDLATRRFVALRDVLRAPAAASAIDAWRRREGIGLLHLHGVDPQLRARLALIDSSLPAVATLHDVAFIAPRVFEAASMPPADAAWIGEIAASLERVQAVVVPSAFIRREVERAFGAITLVDIAPGSASVRQPPEPIARPSDFVARAPRHVVAIVGAIGPHKGSELVAAIGHALGGCEVGLVVIGYTDKQLARGWSDGHYVHGPYRDSDLPALLAAYGVEIVLFANRLPESFSYTLSEVWSCGIPVIVPADGALGERVARHGGGWCLPSGFGAAQAAALALRLLGAEGAHELARVKSRIDPLDADRIPTLASMSRALERLYDRFAVPAQRSADGAPIEALAPLLAVNLDGFAFRAELVRFAEELDNARAAIAELQATLANTQQWAAKLERDVAELQREVRLRDHQLRGLPRVVRAWLRKRALSDRR
jgi:glycosyltransferase involved in cell wall biosynthesis